MTAVSNLYVYPIKGLSPQDLPRADVAAGLPFRRDREFALARPSSSLDREDPKWAKKGNFAMLMLDEGLARVSTRLNLDDLGLKIEGPDQRRLEAQLDREEDRRAIEFFFWSLLPGFPAAPVLVRSRGGHFMDKPDNVISLINLASVRALEQRWGVTIDPLRFRANIYIDGAAPFAEFGWVGNEIKIGGLTFAVDRRNGRCGATNVNPATAVRDLDIPGSLRATFGHKDLGVYLIAKDRGAISVGDTLETPEVAASPAHENAAARPLFAPHARRFLCNGCYFIYDEETQGALFAALPESWRCPDCGATATSFRRHATAHEAPARAR
jgi:GntR family transcriptional regulator/MocR family aminotransferase